MIPSLVLSLRAGLHLGLLGSNLELLGAQKINLFRKKAEINVLLETQRRVIQPR